MASHDYAHDYAVSVSGGYADGPVRRPVKSTRRRIICPTLPAIDGAQRQERQERPRLNNASPEPLRGDVGRLEKRYTRSLKDLSSESFLPGPETFAGLRPRSEEPRPDRPVTISVRVIYFSKDGDQADAGGVMEIETSTGTTVEALLHKIREKVGVGNKGRLLYKGRPVTIPTLGIEKAGLLGEPQALHFMLSRKHRPADVAEQVKTAAAELAAAMAQAEIEAAARGPRRKRNAEVSRPGTASSIVSCGRW